MSSEYFDLVCRETVQMVFKDRQRHIQFENEAFLAQTPIDSLAQGLISLIDYERLANSWHAFKLDANLEKRNATKTRFNAPFSLPILPGVLPYRDNPYFQMNRDVLKGLIEAVRIGAISLLNYSEYKKNHERAVSDIKLKLDSYFCDEDKDTKQNKEDEEEKGNKEIDLPRKRLRNLKKAPVCEKCNRVYFGRECRTCENKKSTTTMGCSVCQASLGCMLCMMCKKHCKGKYNICGKSKYETSLSCYTDNVLTMTELQYLCDGCYASIVVCARCGKCEICHLTHYETI